MFEKASILTPFMKDLLRSWQGLPKAGGGCLLPERRCFDIQSALAQHHRMSIVKFGKDDDLQAELVRLDCVENWQRSLAGISVYDLASPQMRQNIKLFYTAVLEKPCSALMTEQIVEKSGRQRTVSTLMLPFADRYHKNTIILGFTSSSSPGFQPVLRHQILLTFNQLKGVSWLDLGYGVPGISFPVIKDSASLASSQRRTWWDRFLPQGSKHTEQAKADQAFFPVSSPSYSRFDRIDDYDTIKPDQILSE